MNSSKKIIFEAGDIAIVSRTIPWSKVPPVTRCESPFLFLENLRDHPDFTIQSNRWRGLVEEKTKISTWPSYETELQTEYSIHVFRPKTKTHDVFLGKCQKLTNFRFMHVDEFTGLWLGQ